MWATPTTTAISARCSTSCSRTPTGRAFPPGARPRRAPASCAGTDRALALGELAARQARKLFRVSATETPSTPSWPNGVQACEVEIEIASLASCDDVGRIINHMIVEGQVHGGVAQGAGQALYE